MCQSERKQTNHNHQSPESVLMQGLDLLTGIVVSTQDKQAAVKAIGGGAMRHGAHAVMTDYPS